MSGTASDEQEAVTSAPSSAQMDEAPAQTDETSPEEPGSEAPGSPEATPEDVRITPGLVLAGVIAVAIGVGLGLVMSAVSLGQ